MTRHPLILAAVAGALALCACGSDAGGQTGSKGSKGSTSQDDKAYEGALKFAKCMREHGVDMPDPTRDAGGGIEIRARRAAGERGADGPDPKMEAAQKDCEKHLEAGGGPPRDPAQEARMQDAFFAYARCMRAEGIDMPDPKVSGGKVLMRVGSEKGAGGPDPDSAQFKAADKTCHQHLAALEREGPAGTKEGAK